MNVIINKEEYKIIKELGKGGYGIVYKLEKDNKFYAYKKILINNLTKEEIDNYNEEAKILSSFDNDYIVKYYYSFFEKEYFNILMEYGGDKNLKQFIQITKGKKQLIKEPVIKDIIKQICLGLKEIHKAKLIHRDLTPENIFINENNKIKIGDFGVSKRLTANNKYAKTNTGKEHYKAPEIVKGEKYDIRADIYSLGCIIYELFTLNEYFIDKFYEEKEGKIDIETYNPKWQDLIDSLLKKEYNERPFIDEVYYKIEEIKIEEIIDKNNFDLNNSLKEIINKNGLKSEKNNDNKIKNNYNISYIPSDQISQDDNFINFKLIMLGDSDVGKSDIPLRAFTNKFDSNYQATIGFEFILMHFRVNELKMKLQVWDTCGQEMYRSLIQGFYRNASLAIIIYNVCSEETYKGLDSWIKDFKVHAGPDVPFFIVGNNKEAESAKVISTEEAEIFADKSGAKFFIECSSKTGNNINEIFIEAAKCLYDDYKNPKKKLKNDFSVAMFELVNDGRFKKKKVAFNQINLNKFKIGDNK